MLKVAEAVGQTQPPSSYLGRLTAANWHYVLDGQPVVLRVAWLLYAHCAPARLRALCQALRAAGFHAVLLPISWAQHAPERGVIDLDGGTHPACDLVTALSTTADLGLGVIPVPGPAGFPSAMAGLPPWLTDGPGATPSPLDAQYRDEIAGWYETLVQTIAATAPDSLLAWAIPEPPGPSRQDAAMISAYRGWLRQRYDDASDLAREWQRPIPPFDRVAPPAAAACPAEQRDWRLFDASVRADTVIWLAQRVHETIPEVPVMVLAAAQRHPLARVVQLREAGDLLAFAAAEEPASALPVTFPVLDEWQPATIWPAVTGHREASPLRPGRGTDVWRIGLGALARGAQSLGWLVPAGTKAAADREHWTALQRLHQFLDQWEHELAQSLPLHDPLVVLWHSGTELVVEPDEPLGESSVGRLIRLLTWSGWSPECLDLADLGDETLGEFLAAVVVGRGHLDLAAYGRLVVYAVGGGHLLTIGTPIVTDESGRRLNTRVLYPRPIWTSRSEAEGGGRGLGQWLRRRLTNRHRWAVGTESVRAAVRDVPVVFGPGPGDDLWWQWQGRRRGLVVAYRANTHSGSSTVIGSDELAIAGVHVGSQAARQLLTDVLDPLVPRHLVPAPQLALDLAVRRLASGGALLFAGNAGPAQQGTIQLRSLEDFDTARPPRVDVIATAGGSAARLEPDGETLWLSVDAGDAIIVRLR